MWILTLYRQVYQLLMNGLRTVRFRPHLLLLNESSLFKLMQERLKAALDERFDDIEECKDIQEHGCASCAPYGFIYYHETRKFFDEYEEEIEQELEDIFGTRWMSDMVASQSVHNTVTYKNYCVWVIVELYCQNRRDENEDTSGYHWKDGKLIAS